MKPSSFYAASAPIAVIDSGFGGLSVLSALKSAFPSHDFLYFADSINAPYGNKDPQQIARLTYNAIGYLFELGCRVVILACNTASTVLGMIETHLHISYPTLRVIGIVEPTIRAIRELEVKNLGVLATQQTVRSNVYSSSLAHIRVAQEACPNWATLIENDLIDSDETTTEIAFHIYRLLTNSINLDGILLGCTHYAFLLPRIKKLLPESITVLTQGKILADELGHLIATGNEDLFSKNGQCSFLTSGNTAHFDKVACKLLSQKIFSQTTHTYA